MSRSEHRDITLLRIWLTVLGLTSIVCVYFSSQRFWGINPDRSFPIWLGVVLSGALLVCLTTYVVRPVGNGLAETFATNNGRNGSIIVWVFSIAVIAAILFLRCKTLILGDGYSIINRSVSGEDIAPFEPLNLLFCKFLLKLFPGSGTDQVTMCYRSLSFAAGLATLLSIWHFVKSTPQRIVSLLIILTSGTTLLFCGYVERYPITYALMFVYLLSAHRDFEERRVSWFSGLFLIVILGFHLAAGVLLPSFLFLVYNRYRARWLRLLLIAVAASAFCLAMLFVAFKGDLSSVFVSAIPGSANPYHFFSSYHLRDLTNIFLLSYPLLAVLLVSKWFWKADRRWFTILALVPSFAFVLIVDPKLGGLRDWDLLSFAFPAYAVLTILMMNSLAKRKPAAILGYVPALLILAVINFGSWLYLNHQERLSYEVTKAQIAMDIHYSPKYEKGRACVSWYFLTNKYFDDGVETMRAQKCRLEGDPTDSKSRYNYIMNLNGTGNYEEAANMLSGHWREFPLTPAIADALSQIFEKARRYDEMEKLLITSSQLFSPSFEGSYNIGYLMALRGANDSALVYFGKAMKLNPSAPAGKKFFYALLCARQGKSEAALAELATLTEPVPKIVEERTLLLKRAIEQQGRATIDSLWNVCLRE